MTFVDSKITEIDSCDAEKDFNDQINKLSTPRCSVGKSITRRSNENIDSGSKRINSKQSTECNTTPGSLVFTPVKVQIKRREIVVEEKQPLIPDSLAYNYKTHQESNKDSFLKR